MGTNYYCGDLHIGKSSYGWEFTFQAHPKHDIMCKNDWDMYLKDKRIIDEYDRELTFEEFQDVVVPSKREERYGGKLLNHFDEMQKDEFRRMQKFAWENRVPVYITQEEVNPPNVWKDSQGYAFSIGEFS